jgi:hypothetical protein
MDYQALSAPVEQTLPPPLHEMDWQRFERMTVDLYLYEPNIATSDPYGKNGQSQFGIDVIARRTNGAGIEVVSCKSRAQDIKAGDLVKWSTDFIKHWDARWKNRRVRRFVLATSATNTHEREIQDQIDAEIERFRPFGVDYELWSPKQFAAKFRPQRALAFLYLRDPWATIICGATAEPGVATTGGPAIVAAAMISQIADLQSRLTGSAQARLDDALAHLRAGRLDAVEAFVREMRDVATWDQIDDVVRARVLRLGAATRLRAKDLAGARELDSMAEALHPGDEPRIAAQIAFEAESPAAALKVLGTPTTVPGRQLRTVLLIVSGDLAKAADLVTGLTNDAPNDPETVRLDALLALARNAREEALRKTLVAESLAPEWVAVRQLGVIARYAACLSPVLDSDWFLYPNAIDASFLREDLASQTHLAEALVKVDQLIAADPGEGIHRFWRLAILASLRSHRNEASSYAATLLADTSHDPTVVAWCLHRGLDVDLETSEAVLLGAYRNGASVMQTRILGVMLMSRQAGTHGAALLQDHLDRQEPAARADAQKWIEKLANPAAVLVMDEHGGNDDAEIDEALRRARDENDWSGAATALDRKFLERPVDPAALSISELAATHGQWEMLSPHIDALLEFGTATAIRLAAFAAYNNNDPAGASTIIDDHKSAFGEALPHDLRVLHANAQMRVGHVPEAISEFTQLASQSDNPATRLHQADALFNIGDIRGAMPIVRQALGDNHLSAERALRWSRNVRAEDPELSRQLVLRSARIGIADELIVPAAIEAARAGLAGTPEAQDLTERMMSRALAGAPDIRLFNEDEHGAIEVQRRGGEAQRDEFYRHGAIPAHWRYFDDLSAFARLHLGRADLPHGDLKPRHIRHGGRPRVMSYDRPWSSWRVHIDISGLMEAYRFRLLDLLEMQPQGVAISPLVPSILTDIERELREGREGKEAALRAILENVAAFEEAQIDTEVIAAAASQRSVADLFVAMAASGFLDTETIERHSHRFGYDRATPVFALAEGDRLKLSFDAAITLGALGILPSLAARCRPAADRRDLARAAREIAIVEDDAHVAECVRRLRERVAAGLVSGVYRPLQQQVSPASDGEDDEERAITSLDQSLLDVIEAAPVVDAVAWVDDRYVSGHNRANNMPIIGILEALEAIRAEGVLSNGDHRQRLARLRESGAAFIPFDLAELIGPLLQARNEGYSLIENTELVALRRALAMAGLAERDVKIGATPYDVIAGQPDEFVTVSSTNNLLADGLVTLWSRPGLSIERRIACSEWLWRNTRKTHIERDIPGDQPGAGQALFEVLQISSCIDKAFEIGGLRAERRQLQQNFMSWLWQRAVQPLADADPTFLERLGAHMAHLYDDLARRQIASHSQREARLIRILIAKRIDAIPDPLRLPLFKDARMRSYGGVLDRIKIGRAQFDADRFWPAVRRARCYGSAKVRSDRGRILRLRRAGEGVRMSGTASGFIGDDTMRLVSVDLDRRIETVNKLTDKLLLGPDVGSARARLERESGAAGLARVFRNLQAVSAEHAYRDIRDRLARRERFRLDLFAPRPIGSILARLALPAAFENMDAILERAFHALKERVGDLDARIMLAGVAHKLPSAGPADSSEAWRELLQRARTPLAIVQAGISARAAGADDASLAAVVGRLADAIEGWGKLAVALLQWTQRYSLRDPEWRSINPVLRLTAIWAHADQILDLVIGGRIVASDLEPVLDKWRADVQGIDVIGMAGAGPIDVAWPSTVSPQALLYHGLGAIFGDDDLRTRLPQNLLDRLHTALTIKIAEVISPEPFLLMRDPARSNVMCGFLLARPVGLLNGNLDPVDTRRQLIESALAAIEANERVDDAWMQLAGFAAGGLSSQQFDRLTAALDCDKLGPMAARLGDHFWRPILAAIAIVDPEGATERLIELASDCHHIARFGGVVDWLPDPAEIHSEFVEISAIIANRMPNPAGHFGMVLERLTEAWPDLACHLRDLLNDMLISTSSERAGPLWRAWLRLRAFV